VRRILLLVPGLSLLLLTSAPPAAGPATRELAVEGRYVNLPVKTGAPKQRMRYVVDGKTVREFEIELADGEPDFWAFDDVTEFKAKKLRIEVDALLPESKGLASVVVADAIKGGDDIYKEKRRPQFHFTSKRGWLNDPNGLVYLDGEYHLFYQHNPYGWDWGNMHWGHAVSKDLVHWDELPTALYPRKFGDWCFSGSAVVDRDNTSGFGTADKPPLVAAFSSTGRGECIVYSTDRGRTWTEYEKNPVVKHAGRDPRLLWHEKSKQWVMAVYDEADGKQWIAFHTSPDLKEWKYQSRIEGFFECPDLFELPVAGAGGEKKWVLYAADGKYLTGDFDGKAFTPDGKEKKQLWYGNFYAAQTFSNAPDGRRIQIGWAQGISFPGMPFNQQMTVPCQLTLHKTDDGVRMFAEPVKELEALIPLKTGVDAVGTIERGDSELTDKYWRTYDLTCVFKARGAEAFGFTGPGVSVTYDVKKQELTCGKLTAPLKPIDGEVRLRILVDRASIEVFANDGRVALSVGTTFPGEDRTLSAFTRGGAVHFSSTGFPLKSAWDDR
jgi:fructan beta-fructosidase